MYHRVEDVKAKPASQARGRKPQPAKVKVAARSRPKSAPKVVKKPKVAAKPATKPAAVMKKAVATKAVAAKVVPLRPVKPTPAKAVPAKPTPVKPAPAKSIPAKVVPLKVAPKTPVKPPPPPAPAAVVAAPQPKRPARKSIKEAAGVSTDAVARRTGKSWDDWFEVLDSAGAASLDQRGVIAILAQKHGIGPWWHQMIAVGYESLRSKSDKPPAADGFRINSSCTLDAPLPRVFRLWNDAGERARWLADDRFVVRGTTADKSIRARWGKGTSHVAVSFAEKSGRTEVSVEHHQIESSAAAEQMKAYWAKKLGLLEALAPRR